MHTLGTRFKQIMIIVYRHKSYARPKVATYLARLNCHFSCADFLCHFSKIREYLFSYSLLL